MNSTKRFIIPVSVVTRRARPNLVTTVEYLFLFNRNKNLWGEHKAITLKHWLLPCFAKMLYKQFQLERTEGDIE